MLQKSCTPRCTALPSRYTPPGESRPPAPHRGMQLTRRRDAAYPEDVG